MSKQSFIDQIAPAAIEDMLQTGVLASITIAQACLESGWGASAPCNNLFGIKGSGTTQTTDEFVNGKWITIQANFRTYLDWFGSISDHSEFLLENPRYRNAGFLDRCAARDYTGAARALQTAGYATDPQYAEKLIKIIESNGLQEYDQQEVDNMPMKFEFDWQWKQLGDSLDGLYKKGFISDYSWVEKAYTRQMTQTELAWLNMVVCARQQGIAV